jgi:flagellar biosynthetic protein FlhB
MAEKPDSSQERTEEPTPKRLREAREKGQAPRSRELAMTVVMLLGSGALLVSGAWFVERVHKLLVAGFTLDRAAALDSSLMLRQFGELATSALQMLAPLLLVLLVAALITPAFLGGWVFSWQAVAPKAEKLSPVKGLKRVFGPKGLMELLKSMGKFAVVGSAAALFIWVSAEQLLALGQMPLIPAMRESASMIALALLLLSASLVAIAAIDVPFQLHTHHKEMRMTRQEVREELKQTEGRPEVKSKIRETQQALARRRMMQEVPRADVVVTNPTHYSVALRYRSDRMNAPVVVAKGVDRVALRIREIAEETDVPLFEAPPLARALNAGADIGQPIPPELYVAVAEVLAWVYQVRRLRPGEPAPKRPDPEVDDPGR